MVLRLSDLVKKSIDKGYGSSPKSIEKPWTQGNLSSIDLKTGNNPFIKNTPVKCLQITPLPCNDHDHEGTPRFNTVNANIKAQNDSHAVNINSPFLNPPPTIQVEERREPRLETLSHKLRDGTNASSTRTASSGVLKSEKHWWENINFSEATNSSQSMRLLVNYNLLCEDA